MPENSSYNHRPIGEIVANDFRSASVFSAAGIDFCCGGKKTLESACAEKSIDPSLLVKQLAALEQSPMKPGQDYNQWDLAFLADYIMNTHHKYVLKTLPELVFYTEKIASVHGSHHPELVEVANLFGSINKELLQHLQKEEEVLFPAIREALKSDSSEAKATIRSEIARMNEEHEFAGSTMDRINEITSSYRVPEDGCNTYHVTYKLLRQFEDDLHIHVHLENNILFAKALLI